MSEPPQAHKDEIIVFKTDCEFMWPVQKSTKRAPSTAEHTHFCSLKKCFVFFSYSV